MNRYTLPTLILVLLPALALGGEPDGPTADTGIAIPPPTVFVTEHSGTFNGRRLRYRAQAGETYLGDAEGEPRGSIFSFDYVAIDDDETRPVTFVWNGGPGSASSTHATSATRWTTSQRAPKRTRPATPSQPPSRRRS
jgi:hypothetical protein